MLGLCSAARQLRFRSFILDEVVEVYCTLCMPAAIDQCWLMKDSINLTGHLDTFKWTRTLHLNLAVLYLVVSIFKHSGQCSSKVQACLKLGAYRVQLRKAFMCVLNHHLMFVIIDMVMTSAYALKLPLIWWPDEGLHISNPWKLLLSKLQQH